MANLAIQAPWQLYANKVRELFKRDPEIVMLWDDETLTLNMYVDNPAKADALTMILPAEKEIITNRVVKIVIHPSNSEGKLEADQVTIANAFEGNPVFKYMRFFPNIGVTYVVFAKEVIQYFSDDIGDLFCCTSCLAEDLARDILVNTKGIFFCTDIE